MPARERPDMKIASIGAHPDDIEIGSGGTIAKHHARNDKVHAILCTFGGVSGDPAERRLEADNAAKILGVSKTHYLDYSVNKLNKPSREFATNIKAILDEISPDRIYVHSPYDYHQVHVAISKSVSSIVKDIPQVLFYETISSTTTDFKPDAFVDITNYIDLKIKSIEVHKSQSNRFYLQPSVIRSLANTRYVWGKVGENPQGLAEAFKIHKFEF